MNVKKNTALMAIFLMVSTIAQAKVIPGRWEKVAAEKAGSKMIVSLKTGDRIECAFVNLSTDSLVVSTLDGVERKYSKANVERITTADKRMGSLVNGTIIGAASTGIPIAILCAKYCNSSDVAPVIAIWTGIGAGIGLAIDAGVKGYITLYEAPGTPNP